MDTGKTGATQKLKAIKKPEMIIALILILAVIVIFATTFFGEKEEESDGSFESWCAAEEKRLAKVLSGIEGAGKVSVMITYESSVNKVYAYETTSKTSGGVTTVSEEIVYTSGKPLLIKEEAPKVRGVVVVAEGASDTGVKLAIVRAIMALIEVSPGNIEVFASK